MATSTTAPVLEPLTIYKGQDFSFAVPFTAGAGDPGNVTAGNPIPLSSPRMQIRTQPWVSAPLIVTPTLSVSSNIITVTLTSAVLLAITQTVGYYDLFATRIDLGTEVPLLYGPVSFTPNITTLP